MVIGQFTQDATGSFTIRATMAEARVGRMISGLVVAILVIDGATKTLAVRTAAGTPVELGYPENMAPWIGATLLACSALYLVRRTAVIGTIVLTGFLGGAVAAQVRLEDPWFLLPAALLLLAWLGLALRDGRVRALFDR